MKKSIKNNLPLILAIALPIMLIIIFAIAQFLPKFFVLSPEYNLVFATNYYESQNDKYLGYRINIKNNKLVFEYRKLKYQRTKPEFFIFDAKNNILKKINYNLPKVTNESWHIIKIPELDNLLLDDNKKSKDGYILKSNRKYNGLGLLDLFFTSRYSGNYAISKDNYNIEIKPLNNQRFYQVHFIGWVLNDK